MKKITYLAPVLIAAFLASCASSKQTTQTTDKSDNFLANKISTYKKIEFERYFFEGIKERDAGNYQRAAQQFEKATEMDPNSAAGQYELGRAYLQLGHPTAAENAIKKAATIDPENKWYQLYLAEIYKYQRKWADGASIYQKLVEKHPEQPDYYLNLAAFYLQDGKLNEAIKTFDQMEKQFGATEEVVLQKYRIYFESGKYEKAEEEVNKLIAQNPDEAKYYRILAETYAKAGDNDKAFDVYSKLLQKDSTDGNTQLAVAEYYYRKGDKAQGFGMLKKAFANPSLSVDNKIGILYTYYLMKEQPSETNRDEAYALTETLVKTHPEDAKSHAIYGDFLYQDKKMEQAREEYRKSIAQKNDVFAVWQQIFFIDSEIRDYADLEKVTKNAMEYFPSQPLVYFFSGVAKNEQKKYKEAVADLESGVVMVVDNPAVEAQFYINMGEAYYRMKDYKNSDASFDKALAADPNNATALNNYAYYLSERNENLAKAEEMSKKSLSKEPDNSSYLDTYGWILYKMGKYDDAAKFIKRSLDKEESSDVLEHYGDVMFKLGNTESAVQYWKKAKEKGASSANLDKKIAEKKLYE